MRKTRRTRAERVAEEAARKAIFELNLPMCQFAPNPKEYKKAVKDLKKAYGISSVDNSIETTQMIIFNFGS